MKKYFSILLLLTGFSILQGCIVPFVAGAAASAVVINDRRNIQTMSDDQQIHYTAYQRIMADTSLTTGSHIVVEVFDRNVLLVGEAPTADVRDRVEALVRSLPKVRRVYNQITISPPATAAELSQDSWVTTKVKTQMLATKGLNSGQVKVVTENGSVYLLGIVTHDQAQLAVDVARHIAGVQRVVKLFEYSNL
jgi:osmotically-inducible protein OsmY